MKYPRLAATLAVAAFALAACSSGSSTLSTFPNTPSITPTPAPVTYAALGDGRAVGLTASVPCPVAPSGPALPTPANCPGGTGYVPTLARMLGAATLVNLGIDNAVLGPDLLADFNAAPGNLGVTDDIITRELPLVPANATVVTVFAGLNDIEQIVQFAGAILRQGGDPTAFVNAEMVKYENDRSATLAAVKTKAPAAKIVVANLPNYAWVSKNKNARAQAIFYSLSAATDTYIHGLAQQGPVVVDLLCTSALYAAAPNQGGVVFFAQANQTLIAQQMANQIAATAPQAPVGLPAPGCPPYSSGPPAPAPSPTPTPGQTANPFAGTFAGSYTGTQAGTLTLVIAASGAVSGTAHQTSPSSAQYSLSGSIDTNGNLVLNVNAGTATFPFAGKLTLNGVQLTGTIVDAADGFSVTLTMTKQ